MNSVFLSPSDLLNSFLPTVRRPAIETRRRPWISYGRSEVGWSLVLSTGAGGGGRVSRRSIRLYERTGGRRRTDQVSVCTEVAWQNAA